MSISSLGGSAAVSSSQYTRSASSASRVGDADGDNDGSKVGKSGGGGGKFAAAISQALSQLGASSSTSGASSTSGTTSATDNATAVDPQQALTAFVQNLFAALHAQTQAGQQASGSSAGNGTDSTSSINSTGSTVRHQGGVGKIEGDLQSLIQQLSSSSTQAGTGSSTSDSSSGTSTGSAASGTSLDALQQSFNSLLSADGVPASTTTLTNFLKTLSQNLQGAPATGNVVSTTA